MGDAPNTKPTGPYEVLVKAESTEFTYEDPDGTDILTILEAELDTMSMEEYELVDESRRDRGRRATDRGGLADAVWSLSFRLTGSGTAGTVVAGRQALWQSAAGLDYNLYSGGGTVTVDSYANGAGDDFTVTIIADNGESTATTLEDGTDFDAETSNDVTATNIAAVFDAITGVTSTSTAAVVSFDVDAGYRDITVACTDAATYVTIADDDDRCYYASDASDPSTTVSITAYDRQQLSMIQLWGCIADTVELTGSIGEYPQCKISGTAARRLEFEATTLSAAVTGDGDTTITVTDPSRFRTGLSDLTESGLEVYVDIMTDATTIGETVKITALNKTTGVHTVVRDQKSNTGTTHANSLVVRPFRPPTMTYEAGLAMASNESNWSATIDGTTIRLRSFGLTLTTGREFDERASGIGSSDSIHNNAIECEGFIEYTRNLERQEHERKVEAGTVMALVVTMGSTAGSVFVAKAPVAYPKQSESALQRNVPTVAKITFDSMDNAPGTDPGVAGQFQIYCS